MVAATGQRAGGLARGSVGTIWPWVPELSAAAFIRAADPVCSGSMEILLATGNEHKTEEFRRLFPGHVVLMPKDVGLVFDHEETGRTFLENALGKARALYQTKRRPIMADDSGLCVTTLGGAPGIESARYGAKDGVNLGAEDRNRFLLSQLGEAADRNALFVCCLVLVLDENRFLVAQETLAGEIATHPSGAGGFGYDPLFVVSSHGCTVAELPDPTKDRISHRGRAAARLRSMMGQLP